MADFLNLLHADAARSIEGYLELDRSSDAAVGLGRCAAQVALC